MRRRWKRENLSSTCAFYSRTRRWMPAKQRQLQTAVEMAMVLWFGCRRMVWAPLFRQWSRQTVPHILLFFQNFQNRFKFAKSNWMPYINAQIPKVCMRIHWRILKNFLDCADFKFPMEFMLKILEPIQYLNIL
jgi:hypothetical protein